MAIREKIHSFVTSKFTSHDDRKIGLEEETIIYDYNNNRIPVNPGRGFSAVELVSTLNGLGSNNGHYSLEPGGQIEWSSLPLKNLNMLDKAIKKHHKSLKEICREHKLKIVSFGLEPCFKPLQIELIKDKKYACMDEVLVQNGKMGRWMMRNTASIQINFDVTSKLDMEEMTFISDCLHPIASYLFSNSPYKEGFGVGMKNYRNIIWENTDNSRCKNLFDHGISTPTNLLDKYIEFVLTVPHMFNLEKSSDYREKPVLIGEWLAELEESENLVEKHIDFALHQIFTNVRLKKVVEVRGSDRTPFGYEITPAAFWSGILINPDVKGEVLSTCKRWSKKDRISFNLLANSLEVNSLGPEGKKFGEWIEWACKKAVKGLKSRNFGEEKLLQNFVNEVVNQGPFTLQIQKHAPTFSS